ncbi:phage host-nuclease inhibitor protein Gam, partial [Thermostichus sp. MS-CIW-38]
SIQESRAQSAEENAARLREIEELRQSIQESRAQSAEENAARLREIEELRQSIQESRAEFAEQAAAQAQSLRELQQVVSETRSDLAHLAEWAEEVTQALVTLTALQREHERAIQAINQRQAETDQRFNVLLEEVRYLIRRQGSDGNPPPSLP